MRSKLVVVLAVSTVLACSAGSGADAPFNESIRVEELRADLQFLAGDRMQGRLSGTPENELAAEFIRMRFARLGLEPAADGSYYQAFDRMRFALGDDNRLRATVDGARVTAALGADFTPLRFGNGSASGPLTFAGFGIVSPPLEHDDFEGLDLGGRIVLMLDHEPGETDVDSPFDGLVTAEVSRDWRKALAAQRRGAAGVLFVRDVHNHGPGGDLSSRHRFAWEQERRIPSTTLASWIDAIEIPAATISTTLADRLLAPAGTTLAELAAVAESGDAGRAIDGTRVGLTTDVQRLRVADRNVVAQIRGGDPALADEAVIICAHFDHDGAADTMVLNGADDDGSGTVGLLAIAKAYALAAGAGSRPRRSVLFAAWNSEERGLLGAWAYTEDPLFALENTAAVLNMDMIGRNEEVPEDGGGRFRGLTPQSADDNANSVHLMGYSYSSSLRSQALAANEAAGLELELAYDGNPSNLLRRSDHWPFLQRGVPALFFHTGLHPDYHRDTDTVDRINFTKMARIVRFVHALSWELANSDERPALDERRGTL